MNRKLFSIAAISILATALVATAVGASTGPVGIVSLIEIDPRDKAQNEKNGDGRAPVLLATHSFVEVTQVERLRAFQACQKAGKTDCNTDKYRHEWSVPFITVENANKLEKALSLAWNRFDARVIWRMNTVINNFGVTPVPHRDYLLPTFSFSGNCLLGGMTGFNIDTKLSAWDGSALALMKASDFCDGLSLDKAVSLASTHIASPAPCGLGGGTVYWNEVARRYSEAMKHALTKYYPDYWIDVAKAFALYMPQALDWGGFGPTSSLTPGTEGGSLIAPVYASIPNPVQFVNLATKAAALDPLVGYSYIMQKYPYMLNPVGNSVLQNKGVLSLANVTNEPTTGIAQLEQLKYKLSTREDIFNRPYQWSLTGAAKPTGSEGVGTLREVEAVGYAPFLRVYSKVDTEISPRPVSLMVSCLQLGFLPFEVIFPVPVSPGPLPVAYTVPRVHTQWMSVPEGYEIPKVKGVPSFKSLVGVNFSIPSMPTIPTMPTFETPKIPTIEASTQTLTKAVNLPAGYTVPNGTSLILANGQVLNAGDTLKQALTIPVGTTMTTDAAGKVITKLPTLQTTTGGSAGTTKPATTPGTPSTTTPVNSSTKPSPSVVIPVPTPGTTTTPGGIPATTNPNTVANNGLPKTVNPEVAGPVSTAGYSWPEVSRANRPSQCAQVANILLVGAGVGTGINTNNSNYAQFNDASFNATKDFQGTIGFTGRDVDGILGPQTWPKLITKSNVSSKPYWAALQIALIAKGYSVPWNATVNDPETLAALKQYNQSRGMNQSNATLSTWSGLLSPCTAVGSQPSTTQPNNQPTTPEPTTPSTSVTTANFPRLSRGDLSHCVQMLNALLYGMKLINVPTKVDDFLSAAGDYGNATEAAIIKYRQQNGFTSGDPKSVDATIWFGLFGSANNKVGKILAIQIGLYKQGYDVPISGSLDAKTQGALNEFAARHGLSATLNERVLGLLLTPCGQTVVRNSGGFGEPSPQPTPVDPSPTTDPPPSDPPYESTPVPAYGAIALSPYFDPNALLAGRPYQPDETRLSSPPDLKSATKRPVTRVTASVFYPYCLLADMSFKASCDPKIEGPPLDPYGKNLYGNYYAVAIPGMKVLAPDRGGCAIPWGSVINITNPKNGKSVNAWVLDGGPYIPNRNLDMTEPVEKALDFRETVSPVDVELVWVPAPYDNRKTYCFGNKIDKSGDRTTRTIKPGPTIGYVK